jgi:hypothetical protein
VAWNYDKNTKLKDKDSKYKKQRKYVANPTLTTIFILVQKFIFSIFQSPS